MEVKDKLITLESLKVAYDANREAIDTLTKELENDFSQLSEEIGKQTGTGLSTEAIDKLEEVGNYLVYTTADGGSKWIELISILRNGSSSGNLSSISATYSGGDVAVGTALTNLTGITVTATYSDGSTATVTGYALSGEIAEGENTITVSYGGKTTTFTVTGVAESDGVAVAMTAPVQHVDMEYVGHYSDGGETKYSDARFPCSNGKTMLSEKVFESDTTLKITVTPTANTFQCYLFCSTLLDGERILYVDDTDDLFYYIKSSSEVFAYGWSTEKHEFEYTVKAGYKFGIIGNSTSEMDTDIITVEVV